MVTNDKPLAQMKVVDHGVEQGIRWVTCEAPLYSAVNGYVQIPEGHPWSGKDYDDIDVQVHGGLTFAANSWVGFDCLHLGDWWPGQRKYDGGPGFTDTEWDAAMVAEETRSLARKVAKADAE